jgi:hypothetical protein
VSSSVAPPGWPGEVRAPGVEGWETTAEAWLLDQAPPEYRGYPALRRHVVVLARFVVLHVEAMQAACRRGLSETRGELRRVVPPEVVEAAIAVLMSEDARLSRVRREVGLVEEALRGTRFRARL